MQIGQSEAAKIFTAEMSTGKEREGLQDGGMLLCLRIVSFNVGTD